MCERELEPKEPAPKTADEWVYAATVSLNQEDEANALLHLQRALTVDARHDHAHYMMAVASARRNDVSAALDHLRRAVALNPENRSIARQDPELDSLREAPAFKAALDTPPAEGAAARPSAVIRAVRAQTASLATPSDPFDRPLHSFHTMDRAVPKRAQPVQRLPD